MELSLAFVLLNYLPLGHQWRGSEKPLKHSVHILAVFRVKKGRKGTMAAKSVFTYICR